MGRRGFRSRRRGGRMGGGRGGWMVGARVLGARRLEVVGMRGGLFEQRFGRGWVGEVG